MCYVSLLPKSRSMPKSFNSLLTKFNVSTQETSRQNFFLAYCTCVNFFFWTIVLCRIFFLRKCTCRIFFFQNHPAPPPPSEVKWLAPNVRVRAHRVTLTTRVINNLLEFDQPLTQTFFGLVTHSSPTWGRNGLLSKPLERLHWRLGLIKEYNFRQ